MNCSPEKLNAYADGELSREEREEFAEHLVRCEQCRRELEAIRALSGDLDRLFARERLIVQQMQPRPAHRARRRLAFTGLAAAAAALVLAILIGQPSPARSAIESVKGGTRSGDSVATGPGQIAEIRLKTGTVVSLLENSQLDVMPPPKDIGPLASAALRAGKAHVNAPQTGAGRRAFRMHTTAGDIETTGAQFEVLLAYSTDLEALRQTEDQAAGSPLAEESEAAPLRITALAGEVILRRGGAEEVIRPAKLVEKTPTLCRFEVTAAPARPGRFELKEQTVDTEKVAILPADPGTLVYLCSSSQVSKKVRDALAEVVKLKQALSQAERELADLDRQIQGLRGEQGLIRTNMAVLSPGGQAYLRFEAKLLGIETKVETLQAQAEAKRTQIDKLRKALENYVSELNVA